MRSLPGPEKRDPAVGEQARVAAETSEQEEMLASERRRRQRRQATLQTSLRTQPSDILHIL